MAGSRTLKVEIAGDSSGAQKAFRGVDDAAGRSASSFGKMSGAATAAWGAVGVSAGAVAVELFNTGAQLELLGKKSATVFGDQLGDVQKWADTNASAMGLTTREATGLAAAFADLLIPMGFTRDQAADMATKVVGLSGALAEWSSGKVSAAEASDILAKAMLGETDGLKALGIAISAADIQQRILEKGQKDLTGALREQAEAIATQELIFEKSTDAQHSFANGADSAARKQAELNAKMKEFKDDASVAFSQAVVASAGWIENTFIPAVDKARDKVWEFADYLERAGAAWADAFHLGDGVEPTAKPKPTTVGGLTPNQIREQRIGIGPDTSGGRRVQRMHGGGVFTTPNPSGEGYALLRQGEVVSNGGGWNIYVTVNAGIGADGNLVAQQLVGVLTEYVRRGGRLPAA